METTTGTRIDYFAILKERLDNLCAEDAGGPADAGKSGRTDRSHQYYGACVLPMPAGLQMILWLSLPEPRCLP